MCVWARLSLCVRLNEVGAKRVWYGGWGAVLGLRFKFGISGIHGLMLNGWVRADSDALQLAGFGIRNGRQLVQSTMAAAVVGALTVVCPVICSVVCEFINNYVSHLEMFPTIQLPVLFAEAVVVDARGSSSGVNLEGSGSSAHTGDAALRQSVTHLSLSRGVIAAVESSELSAAVQVWWLLLTAGAFILRFPCLASRCYRM